MENLETKTIEGVEIFAAGTWNGDLYTEKDLDAMVDAFEKTRKTIKPFLKLGHNEKQTILAKDGLPAAGWVENLRKVGNKLVCDFVGVPKAIYELIRAQAYRKVSAEIFWNFALDGEKYPYLLKAVALLGADTPAVASLDDIISLYAKGEPALAYNADGVEVKTYEVISQEEEMEKQIQELQEKLAAVEKLFTEEQAKTAAITAEKDTLTAEKDALAKQAEALTGEVTAEKAKTEEAVTKYNSLMEASRLAEIEGKIDELIAAKKILPAQKETLFAIVKSIPVESKYSVDGAEVGLGELVLKFAEMNTPANLPTEPKANNAKPEEKSADDALDEAVKKFMAEHKVGYRQAYAAITHEMRVKAAEGKSEE